MSTLGGNKGGEREKNPAKPKFAALDINSLYRTSRGEQFEQTTQKNAPPRKHGMQILGKVPSARRPANLPSLKAETSTPTNTPQQATEQQTNASSSASWADSSGGNQTNATSSGTNSSNNNNNNTNSNNSSSSAPHNTTQALNSSGSSSWSAVATGSNAKEEPPLYQSPQFQNEFPSLGDGGTQSSTTSNVNANSMKTNAQNQNSFDSGGGMNLSLRPTTDAASWMQQQQQMGSANSGSARGAANENGNASNYPPADLDGPPKVMALMPSFLRGGNVGIGNISSSSGGGSTNQMNLQKPRDDRNREPRGDNRGRYDRSYNNDYVNNNMPPPRHRQSTQPPRMAGRQQQQQQYNNNDDRGSSYESETVVIQQRPIIREEELDRIDSLARDDAWSRHDEIDYNKKLQFSDDEPDDLKPKPKDISMKSDAWRDSEKRDSKMSQQNGPRSLDPLYVEKIKMVREEEDRKERERKLAAQRKLQELDDKTKQKGDGAVEEKTSSGIGYIINDADKRDYGKSKYINSDKYDSYDSYGRRGGNERGVDRESAAAGGEFKKSSFQSNLPPRFQKQHQHIDERRGPVDKRPLHQQDSKNIPFAQHPPQYEQRWSQYNKNQPNQAPPPRRNMSSLSQSSSDDNPRNGSAPNKPYNRRRQESEEDDYGRYGKDSKQPQQKHSTTLATAQISRSMSDSSDKLSDHMNRSEKSTSREYLGTNVCWAEVCENDKRPTSLEPTSSAPKERRRVSESSAMSDDQPRTILQRNKPLQEQLQSKGTTSTTVVKEKENVDDDKKTVLNEAPPKNATVSSSPSESEKKEKSDDKKSLEIIPEKEASKGSSEKTESESKEKKEKESDDRHSKRSPRYDARDTRDSRGGRGGYGNNYRGNNWNRRGGPHSGRGNRYDYSDSENSEDEWSRGKNANRKDIHHRRSGESYGSQGSQKEGFSPRGEPSRRGRGASSSASSGFHRNSGPVNRIDKYGPPSSKSPFGSNDEKSSSEKKHETSPQKEVKEKVSDDDRIKQKQKALSDGLMNKNMKDNSNVALQKAASPGKSSEDSTTTTSKHSTEMSAFSADQKEKKSSEDDKASVDSKGGRSSSSYTSGPRKNDKNAPHLNKAVSKPQSSSASHVPMTSSSSHYTSSSMSKPQDSRDTRNSGYRDSRGNIRDSRDQGGSNRMAAPRFTNKNVAGSNRMGGSNYWDKNAEGMQDESKMSLMQQLNASQQQNVLKTDQAMKQQPPIQQQALDGASLPKTTLIFENTSLRSGPPPSNVSNASQMKRPNVPPPQMQASSMNQKDNMVGATINEMIEQQTKDQSLTSALQSLSFGGGSGNANAQQKSDMVDMNSFKFAFDTQISQLTDDSSFVQSTSTHQSQTKTSSSLGLVGAKTGSGNSNILNTDSLNLKVASCKKVWEDPSVDHTVTSTAEDVMANFVAQQHLQQYNNSITAHHTGLSPQSFGGYNTGSSNDHTSSLDQHFVSKSNDNDDGTSYPSPQQHMNAHVMHSQSQQANLNMKAAEAFATNANVCKVKPTQMHQSGLSPPPQIQQNMQQHQQTFYPTPNYPNMPTIPSPPVVYNSQATGGLYSYNMDARAQMYGYQASAGANNSLSFNAFMQPSNIASAPTHEVYQNLSQYRATVQPFNQTPQLNNPNAVLISSATATSNSMMGSKSNTPQQIGAIGSKTSGPPPQSGPTAAGQYNQQYMNHLYHQQHASSYYPNSTAQQANPYYNTSGSAATGSYGMFGGTNGQQQMPNYGSVGQFPLNSQMLNNLVINQHSQYRGGPVVAGSSNGASGSNASGSNVSGGVSGGSSGAGGYMKQQHQSQLQDPWDTASSSTGRGYNQQSQNQQTFPTPIQRPSSMSHSNQQQHYQPRSQKSNNSMMSGPKSQFFNSSKREN